MIRAFRFLRGTTPDERAEAYGHATWALALFVAVFAFAWTVTP